MSNISINIHGSCVTRDLFTYDVDNIFKVKKYIERNSILSMTSSPLKSKFINEEIDNLKWEDRMLYYDFEKKSLDELCKEPADYLIIDLVDERFGLIDCEELGGKYITDSQVLRRSKYYFGLENEKKVNPTKLEWNCVQKMYKEYVDILLYNYEASQIVIHEVYPVFGYIDKAGKYCFFDGATIEKVKKICEMLRNYYQELETLIKGCKVLRFPANVMASENHKWKLAICHFEDDYYSIKFNELKMFIEKSNCN